MPYITHGASIPEATTDLDRLSQLTEKIQARLPASPEESRRKAVAGGNSGNEIQGYPCLKS